jgi:hypothetical protein
MARLGVFVLFCVALTSGAVAAPRVLIRATNIVEAAAGTNASVLYMVAMDGWLGEVTVNEGRELRSWRMRGSPTAFDVSLDGRYVALGYARGTETALPLHILDTQSGEVTTNGVPPLDGESGISGLRFASNGKVLVLAETDITNQTRLRMYDPVEKRLHTFTNEITRSNFVESEDRARIATVTRQLGWYSADSDTYETVELSPAAGLNSESLTVRTDNGFIALGGIGGVFSETFARTGSFPSLRSSLPYGVAKVPGADHIVFVADGLTVMEMNTRNVRRIRANAVGTVPGRLRLLRLIDSGRRAVVLTREVVEIISLEPEPFRLVSAHKLYSTNQIVLRFSSPVSTTNVQSAQNYLVTGGSVTRAALHPLYQEMILVTVAGSPTTIRVGNIVSVLGRPLDGPSETAVQQGLIMPDDNGLEVEGYQDSFDSPPGPQWSFFAGADTLSEPDGFRVESGALSVSGRPGSPRYMALNGGYDRENQEVLMRVSLASFADRSIGPACGIGLRPGGSGGDEHYGASFAPMMALPINYGSSFGLGSMPLEISARPGYVDRFGTTLFPPTDNWYWVRLRYSARGDSNGFHMLAKWWPSDGSVPEPSQWLEGRYSSEIAATNPIAGLAGLIAPEYSGRYLVDYMLVRAAGLPRIRVRPDGPRALEWTQPPSDGWGSRVTLAGTASGDAPITYRWYLDDQQVASNATGLITSGPRSEPFRLVAQNKLGSITSAPVYIRSGAYQIYSADLSGALAEWTNAVVTTYQNNRFLRPRNSGTMTLKLPHAPFEGRLLLFGRLWLPMAAGMDLKVSDTAGNRLYKTRISTTSTRVSPQALFFQSFPGQYGEALVPPLTLSYAWGQFDATLRSFGGPVAFDYPFDVEIEVPGNVTNLVFDGYHEKWGFSHLYALAKPAEVPLIRFERAVFQADDLSNELLTTVVRDGGLDATFSVKVLAKPLPLRFSTGVPLPEFVRVTNTLVFGPGVRRLTNRITLPSTPRTNDVHLSLALTNPVGFELVSGFYALGLASSSLEPVTLDLLDGDILSEGHAMIRVRVPSTNSSTVPRAITVRLEPLDGAEGAFETSISVRHGRSASDTGEENGFGVFYIDDDLIKLPDRRWRIRLSEPYYGFKAAGDPFTVTMVDDDSAGFSAFGVNDAEGLVPLADGGFLVSRSFFRSLPAAGVPGPILRVDGNGRIDPGFHVALNELFFGRFMPLSDGWLVRNSAPNQQSLVRIRADGSLDPGFRLTNTNFTDFFEVNVNLGNDSGLFAARVRTNLTYATELWRVDATGAVDESLRAAVGAIQGSVQSMACLSDGRVVIAGGFIQIGTNAISKLAVVSPNDGSVAAFGSFLVADTNQLAVFGATTNGGVMVSQRYQGLEKIVRLRADGSEDPAFQAEPVPYGHSALPVLAPDGGVLLPVAPTNIVRLASNGVRDASFHGPDFRRSYVSGFLPRADGSIVVCGWFRTVNGVSRGGIALLSRTGELLPWPGEPEWPAPATGLSPVTELGGREAVLNATVSGGAPALYQWQRNGISVPGATNLTLTATEPGTYRLAVIGGGVVRTSPEVAVRFVDPAARPRLLINPAGSGTGWRASFTVADGFAHRIEVSEDLRTWTPAEPADFDGSQVRLGEGDRPNRYYRVVVE